MNFCESKRFGVQGFAVFVLCAAIMWNNVKMSSAIKRLGDICTEHRQCDTSLCHPMRKKCECYNLTKYDVGRKISQLYEHGTCVSRLHQVCTLSNVNDDLPTWHCISNAFCAKTINGRGSHQLFGNCNCLPGFVYNDKERRCIIEPAFDVKVSSVSPISDMYLDANTASSSNQLNPERLYAVLLVIGCCIAKVFGH